jgi:hypothetical protein
MLLRDDFDDIKICPNPKTTFLLYTSDKLRNYILKILMQQYDNLTTIQKKMKIQFCMIHLN